MAGIASAATAVVIAHVAGGTRTIRVGAGGIMLPNHAPLVIAEQFGTLEALYPGRIDLGLGRAPGTDQLHAARAAPRSDERRHVPAGRARAAGAARRSAARARRCRRCRARARTCRSGSSARASSARSSRRRSACRTRSPRTSRPTRCCRRSRSTARASSPPRSSQQPYAMVGVNVDRRRRRRRGAPALHLGAAGVHEHLPRRARPAAAADRRHRGVLDARGEGARVAAC